MSNIYENVINKMANGYMLLIINDNKITRLHEYIIKDVNNAFETIADAKRNSIIDSPAGAFLDEMNPDWADYLESITEKKNRVIFGAESPAGNRYYMVEAFYASKNNIALLFEDVTERKQAELQIKFQAFMLENVNCAIGATDFSGNYIYWNKQMEKLFQWKKEEIIGKHLLDLRNDGDMKSDDKDTFNKLQKDGYIEFETNCPRKDKTTFPAHIIVASLKNDKDEIIALVGIHTDISNIKKMEAALLESEERWRYALEGSGNGVWDYSIQSNEFHYSKRWKELLEYDDDEIGDSIDDWFDKVHPDDRKELEKAFKLHLEGKSEQFSFRHRIRCKDNTYKWFLVRGKISKLTHDGKPRKMHGTLSDISDLISMENEIKRTKMKLLDKYSLEDIVGQSQQLWTLTNQLPTIAKSDCNILIEGPSGTGKNLVAKTIYSLSERKSKPYFVINCGSLPDTLVESELFGYAKGAFTDAKADKLGKLMLANGGIVLLDEIGELPLQVQTKLLKFIEEKTFEPLGSLKTIKADVRIIAATNRDLADLVKKKQFREDLYYRLKIVSIKIPALKDRPDDIDILIEHYINILNQKYTKNIINVSNDVHKFLMIYEYPGNVRELQNMLEHAFIFCERDTIKIENFSEDYIAKYNKMFGQKKESRRFKEGKLVVIKESFESKELINALKKNRFSRNETAKYLKISRVKLWRLMKKYGYI